MKANVAVMLAGHLAGQSLVAGERVALQKRVGSRWAAFSTASVSQGGAFRVSVKFNRPGLYRIRAFYPGDSNHLSSQAITVVTVR